MANTREVRSELISREPLLLGAILSVASRFCIGSEQDAAATNAHAHGNGAEKGGHPTSGGGKGGIGGISGASGSGGNGPDETAQASFGLELHQRISQWTHQLAGRVLVDCSLHSVGSVEALLLLSEWSTWGIHSDRQDLLVGEEEDDDDDEDSDEENETKIARDQQNAAATEAMNGTGGVRNKRPPQGNQSGAQQGSNNKRRKHSNEGAAAAEKKSKENARQHAEVVATTSQRFDSMSWMFVGT